MDKFLQFQTFLEVAKEGSFSRAAEELGLTPSAVSKQIRALEDRLGARLLNRTTRRVSLTDAGQSFRERVETVVEEVDEAEQAVAQLQAEPRGVLRVGAPMDFGRAHLANAIAQFATAHASLEVEVEFADRFVDVVEEGFDVVVRIAELADSSLVSRRLAPCRRLVCASPGYLDAHGRPEGPEDLLNHHRVGYAYEVERSWRFEMPSGIRNIAVPVRHRTNNGELMRELLIAGEGLSLLPTFLVAEDLRTGRLEAVLAKSLRADTQIQAVYPHRRHLSPKVRRFVDHLATRYGPRPYWDEGLPV